MIPYRVIAIALLLVLPACLPVLDRSSRSVQKQPTAPDLQLFMDGIDRFDANRRSDAFLTLEQNYPESPWTRRAKVLASLAGSIRLLEKQIQRQQTLIDAQQIDRDALVDLRQENELLREQVSVLKALIVDLELRQP